MGKTTQQKIKEYGVIAGGGFAGIAGFTYYCYNLIMAVSTALAHRKQNKRKGVLGEARMSSQVVKAGVKCVGFLGVYSVGMLALISYFQHPSASATLILLNQEHKADPAVQKEYIFDTMKYFSISSALVQKTSRELKELYPS